METRMQAQSGSIVTPGLPGFKPAKLIVGHRDYVFLGPTRRRLEKFAAAQNVTMGSNYPFGSTWAGSTNSILTMAKDVLHLTHLILQHTFLESADAEGLTLKEWLDDIDWAAHLDPSTKEGQLPWNIARAVDYAESVALGALTGGWETDNQIDPPGAVLDTLAMHDVILMRPGKSNDFNMGLLLQNTEMFCRKWSEFHSVHGGGVRHFAGLIACQASQQEVPDGEMRYAAHLA
jgi:hypothetical protein